MIIHKLPIPSVRTNNVTHRRALLRRATSSRTLFPSIEEEGNPSLPKGGVLSCYINKYSSVTTPVQCAYSVNPSRGSLDIGVSSRMGGGHY